MKMVIDFPEWADERHIRIMAGIEMVAYKLAHENILHLKTAQCSSCGDCCRGLSKRWKHGIKDDSGECLYLEDDGGGKTRCSLLVDRPFLCGTGLQKKGKYPHCTVEYKGVELA